MRKVLTKADWTAFARAADAWMEDAGGAEFYAVVERIVSRRMALAWDQGHAAGWNDGVKDATMDDPPPRSRNPYRAGS